MIVKINAIEIAEQLADADTISNSHKDFGLYVKYVRESAEWQKKYDYYFEVITNKAIIE